MVVKVRVWAFLENCSLFAHGDVDRGKHCLLAAVCTGTLF